MPNTRNLNYIAHFASDTTDIKASLAELNSQLRALSSTKITLDDDSLRESVKAAKDLQKYLNLATDTKTGNLDLSKLSQTLRQAGTDINQLSAKLLRLGPEGNQAFIGLAKTISYAQVPIKKTNALLDEMWATMKNTARWQLTSSALHGFIGALSQAIGYAKDLNRSLTDIRIVTGQSVEQMEKFALQANQAAKNLSTTTVDYTDAALIYYQQGLNDEEVKKRTDITIKAANSAGSSAQEMSEYLTAIWNSYKVGSEELEYFADVIARLGADTATSLEEIATAMQKVAATGNTVGVEYEQLAAIISTVSSVTREAPTTTGTAYKTILARIGDLKLGETVEDGVTLGQVSSKLASIGVNILNTNGDLREMGDIIEEIGAKWQSMNNATKAATAQAIAGKRQYTQLIALFDNWDMYQNNLAIAKDSAGALQEMQDTYEQGWAAASKRVKASFEGVVNTLADDKGIISLTNTFGMVIESVDDTIESFGGLGNIAITLSSIFTQKFSKHIIQSFKDIKDNAKLALGVTKKDMLSMQNQIKEMLTARARATGRQTDSVEMTSIANLISAKQKLAEVSDRLNASEREYANYQLKNVEILSQQVQALNNVTRQKEQEANRLASEQKRLASQATDTPGGRRSVINQYDSMRQQLKGYINEQVKAEAALNRFNTELSRQSALYNDIVNDPTNYDERIKKYTESIKEFINSLDPAIKQLINFDAALAALGEGDTQAALGEIESGLYDAVDTAVDQVAQQNEAMREAFPDLGNQVDQLVNAETEASQAAEATTEAFRQQAEASASLELEPAITGSERLINLASAAGSAYSTFAALQSIGSIWSNEDATLGEKILSTLMSFSILVPSVTSMYEAFNVVLTRNTVAQAANTTGTTANTAAVAANAAAWYVHPAVWIVGAIIALGIALSAVTNKIKEQNEAIKKASEESVKANNSIKEEIDNNDKLVKNYSELLSVYKETGEGKEQLISATEEVCNAYDIEGATLANLTDNYDSLTKSIKKAQEEKDKLAKNQATQTLDATGKSFQVAMREGKGYAAGGLYQTSFNAGLNTYSGDEGRISELIEGAKYLSQIEHSNAVTLTSADTVEEMVAAYEEVSNIVKQLTDETSEYYMDENERANSEVYQSMLEWLEKSKEAYKEYNEVRLDIENYDIKGVEKKLGVDTTTISSLREFSEYQSKYISEATKGIDSITDPEKYKRVIDAAKDYVSTLAGLEKYSRWEQGIQGLDEKTNVSTTYIRDYFEKLSESDKELFWSINFDTAKTEKAWDSQMDILRLKSENAKLEVRIEAIPDAQKALSKAETIDTNLYKSLLEDFKIDWGDAEQGIMEFSEFLNLAQAQQLDYLEELSISSQERIFQNNQLIKEGIELQIEETKQALEENKNEADRALSEIQTTTSLLQGQKNKLLNVDTEEEKEEIQSSIDELQKHLDQEKLVVDIYTNHKKALDDLEKDLADINNEIEINVKVDREQSVKELVDDLYEMKDINDSLLQDIKKVGANYQLTAQQARSWANVYPELLESAHITKEGIVQLNAEQVNDFIKGKEAELIANGEAEIAKLEADKKVLEAKKAKTQAELDLAIAAATAESDIERDVALYKIQLGNELTEIFIQNQVDEATANQLASAAMAGNAEEFARVAKEAAKDTGGNFNQAAYDAAMSIYQAMQSGATNVDQFRKTAADAAKQFASIGSGQVTGGGNAVTGPTYSGGSKGNYTAGSGQFSGFEFDYQAKTTSLDSFIANKSLELSNYDSAIADIDAKIAEIRYAMAASLNSYTPDTARKTDAGKEKKGKGKGGKKGGDDNKKTIEELDKILERYHEINRQIEYQEKVLSRLSEIKSRAFGKNKLKAIDDETKAIEKLREYNEQLYEAQIAFLAIDQEEVIKVASNAIFDETTGDITNYSEIAKNLLDELQVATDKYNKSAQKEADKEAYDKSKKAYEDKIKVLEKYEKTLDGVRDTEDKLLESEYQLQDSILEKITTKVKIDIDVNTDELELLEYYLRKIENRAYSLGDSLGYLTQQASKYEEQSQIYTKGIQELLAIYEKNGYLTDAQAESLREYKSALMKANESLLEINQTMKESFLKALEESTSKLDENIDLFDTYNSILDHYKTIVELSGKASKDFALNLKIASTAVENSINAISGAKSKYELLKETKNDVEQSLKDAVASGDEEIIKYWQDTLDNVNKQLTEAFEEMNSAWAEALQAAADRFDLAIQQTIQTLEDALSPLLTLDQFQEAFDKAQTIKKQYLSTNEQIYELNKLNRQIEEAIANTDSVAAKNELKKLLEEINQIQTENKQLSEYDLKYLKAKYDLKLAEIALEEAQNSKTSMRLVRNDSGNWDYVYTADQTKIDKATQNYEDKLRDLEKLSEEYIDDLSNQIIQNEKDLAEALAAIDRNQYENAQDYYQALKDTAEYYYQRDAYLRSEMEKAMKNLGISYKDTVFGQIEDMGSLDEAHSNLVESTEEAMSNMKDSWTEWKDAVDQAEQTVGEDGANIEENLDSIGNASDDLTDRLESDKDEMLDYMDEVMDKVVEWQEQWSESIQQMIQDNEELMESINEVLKAESQTADKQGNFDPDVDYGALLASYVKNGGEIGSKTWDELVSQRDAKIEWLKSQGYSSDYWMGVTGDDVSDLFQDQDWMKKAEKVYGSNWEKILKRLGISSFASGGYTGDWGIGGKLSILHEKELILNQNDTSNLLSAISILRSMSESIGKQIFSNASATSSLLGQKMQVNDSNTIGKTETIQQVVSIQADFPNVHNASDIEEALNSIVNDAAQYASINRN